MFEKYLIYLGCALGIILLIHVIGRIYWSNKILKKEWVTLKIIPSRLSERNPHVAENIFSALHGIYEKMSVLDCLLGKKQPYFSCEIVNLNNQVAFYLRLFKEHRDLIEGQFYA